MPLRRCYGRHRNHLGSRLCSSNAQVVLTSQRGNRVPSKRCRRPAEPSRVVSRRDVVRGLSCLHRKVPGQFLGGGEAAMPPCYPTQLLARPVACFRSTITQRSATAHSHLTRKQSLTYNS